MPVTTKFSQSIKMLFSFQNISFHHHSNLHLVKKTS